MVKILVAFSGGKDSQAALIWAVNYVNRNDAQLDMFEPEEGYSCMSVYHGLCG